MAAEASGLVRRGGRDGPRGQGQTRGRNHPPHADRLPWHGQAADTRLHHTLAARARYASWTHNLPHGPPDTCGTPDAAGVAAFNAHPCGPGPTGPDTVTAG